VAWINFDEVLLDPFYTNLARGGPEYATATIDTIAGVEQTRSSRYDYISRYQIDFAELSNQRRKDIRTFHILRFGMLYGFRFLAPDDSTDDGKGVLLDASGVQVSSVVNGSTYYLAKRYVDVRTYYRRIVKPIGGAWGTAPQLLLAGSPAASTTNTTNGQIVAGANGNTPTWTGTFHLPARFLTDFSDMATDETTISEWTGIGLRELLPIALGISA